MGNAQNGMKGQEHGKLISWFKNGQKAREGTFKLGKYHGKWIYWNEDGSIKREVTYKDGEVVDF